MHAPIHHADLPQLAQRLRNGCQDAARELVVAFSPLLRRAIRRHLRARGVRGTDEEDVLQQLWSQLFLHPEYLGELQSVEDLLGVLWRIARNEVGLAARK